jgi:hypothetical protein
LWCATANQPRLPSPVLPRRQTTTASPSTCDLARYWLESKRRSSDPAQRPAQRICGVGASAQHKLTTASLAT